MRPVGLPVDDATSLASQCRRERPAADVAAPAARRACGVARTWALAAGHLGHLMASFGGFAYCQILASGPSVSHRDSPWAERGQTLPPGNPRPRTPQRALGGRSAGAVADARRRQRVGASTWKSPSADPSLTARLCAEGPGPSDAEGVAPSSTASTNNNSDQFVSGTLKLGE
jgi:hypothetical protein